jgi:hypothetical protein
VTKITNLLLASQSESRALGQITENESQVVIRLIPYGAEHVSIHAQGSSLLKTYSMPDKPTSTWDRVRVEAARALGYRDPEKHGNYADHRPLVEPYLFELGDHLVGRRVEFASLSNKAKYKNHALTAILPHDPAMIELYFRSDPAPSPRAEHIFEVETTLGWLYVAAKPPA